MGQRNLLTPRDTYIVEYPEAVDFINKQMKIFWFPDEVKVEKDVQDILVNLTESERHATIGTLKLFTQYELIVGTEYWAEVGKMFRKPACVSRMANLNSFMELNVHAPFYSKINEALGLASEKFYNEYKEDPFLRARVMELERYAESGDIPYMLAMLAFTEGVILYSSFAFLKHFQSQGKNKILNIVRGINFSARDEGLHSEASAFLYRTYLQEQGINPLKMYNAVRHMADTVRSHEFHAIDKLFEKGEIQGITSTQMKHFVDSRINLVLRNLGYENLFEVKYNPIAEWFYKGMNDYIANDFFTGQGREYGRNWSEDDFID